MYLLAHGLLRSCQAGQSEATIAEAEKESGDTQEYVELIVKYIDIQTLDSAITHKLIEKIVVHQAQRIDGQRAQQIDIYATVL